MAHTLTFRQNRSCFRDDLVARLVQFVGDDGIRSSCHAAGAENAVCVLLSSHRRLRTCICLDCGSRGVSVPEHSKLCALLWMLVL